MHPLPLFRQELRNGGGIQPCIHQAQGVFRQDGTAQGNGLAVHHMHTVTEFLCRNDGALIGAGKLGRAGDAYHLAALRYRLAENPFKGIGGCLTGGGQYIAFDQLFIEAAAVDGHAVNILIVSKVDGQRHHLHPAAYRLGEVCRGIHDQFYLHGSSLFCKPSRLMV